MIPFILVVLGEIGLWLVVYRWLRRGKARPVASFDVIERNVDLIAANVTLCIVNVSIVVVINVVRALG